MDLLHAGDDLLERGGARAHLLLDQARPLLLAAVHLEQLAPRRLLVVREGRERLHDLLARALVGALGPAALDDVAEKRADVAKARGATRLATPARRRP